MIRVLAVLALAVGLLGCASAPQDAAGGECRPNPAPTKPQARNEAPVYAQDAGSGGVTDPELVAMAPETQAARVWRQYKPIIRILIGPTDGNYF